MERWFKKDVFEKLSLFGFESLAILSFDTSSLMIITWHLSNNFKMLSTLYAVSIVGEIIALVSQNPKKPGCNVILYEEMMNTCQETISKLVFFVYLMVRLLLEKVYGFVWVQDQSYIVVVHFERCCIVGFDLLRSFIHVLIIISNVFVLGCISGKIWKKWSFSI